MSACLNLHQDGGACTLLREQKCRPRLFIEFEKEETHLNNFPDPQAVLCVQNTPSLGGPFEAQPPSRLKICGGSERQGSLSEPLHAVL